MTEETEPARMKSYTYAVTVTKVQGDTVRRPGFKRRGSRELSDPRKAAEMRLFDRPVVSKS